MQLKDCKLGDVVNFEEQATESTPKDKQFVVCCLTINGLVLCGWNEKLSFGWPADPNYKSLIGFKYGFWFTGTNEVVLVRGKGSSITTTKSVGMHCASKLCNEYNDYAQPNQKDGKTYFCYSCKQRPSYMR